MKNSPSKIRQKLDESDVAVIMTKAEIRREKKALDDPTLTKLEVVCKRQRILALRKHLGEIKAFRKEVIKKLKSLK